MDVVAKTEESGGADVTVRDFSIRAAGAAANCGMSAASEGVAVELLGLVGDDYFGELLKDELAAAKVGIRYVRTLSGRTGTVISIVDSAGQTKLYSYRGVNAHAYRELPPELFGHDEWVYISGYSFQDVESRVTAEKLLSQGARCALDPSFQFARNFRDDFAWTLRNLEFVLPNLEEARLMTGMASPEKCAATLRAFGASTVVVKLGAEGCYIDSGGWAEFVKSEPVNAADTTGAGDAFAGGFLASILKGRSLLQAARRGNEMARSLIATPR
jgi:sugar/nucleoside kinase (ribokinase family)